MRRSPNFLPKLPDPKKPNVCEMQLTATSTLMAELAQDSLWLSGRPNLRFRRKNAGTVQLVSCHRDCVSRLRIVHPRQNIATLVPADAARSKVFVRTRSLGWVASRRQQP